MSKIHHKVNARHKSKTSHKAKTNVTKRRLLFTRQRLVIWPKLVTRLMFARKPIFATRPRLVTTPRLITKNKTRHVAMARYTPNACYKVKARHKTITRQCQGTSQGQYSPQDQDSSIIPLLHVVIKTNTPHSCTISLYKTAFLPEEQQVSCNLLLNWTLNFCIRVEQTNHYTSGAVLNASFGMVTSTKTVHFTSYFEFFSIISSNLN